MTELLPAFADIEDVCLALFSPVGTTVLTTADTINPPVIKVECVGGLDDNITDYPRVQVDCFGATRAQARDMAESCRQLALASPGTTISGLAGVSVDRVRTQSRPVELFYATGVRRYVAIYQFDLRRPR